jgi:hypothetical protein
MDTGWFRLAAMPCASACSSSEVSNANAGLEIRRTTRSCNPVQACGTEITLISYVPPCSMHLEHGFEICQFVSLAMGVV